MIRNQSLSWRRLSSLVTVSLVTILLSTGIFVACKQKPSNNSEQFGINQNAARKNLHLVAVDPAFKVKEDFSKEGCILIFVNKREPEIRQPEFLSKTVRLD